MNKSSNTWTHGRRLTALLLFILTFSLLQAAARLIPPLQSPDELAHMIRIASLVEGEWMPITPEGASTGGRFDIGLAPLAQIYVSVIKEAAPLVDPATVRAMRNQGWVRRAAFGEAPGSALYLPTIYAPASLGLFLGKLGGLTVWESYHAARAASHLFCALVIAAAYFLWRPPLLAWGILLLPMAWFQMASPVVDGPAHALLLLLLSLTWRMADQQHTNFPTYRALAGWVVLAVMVVTARLHLAPILLIPVALAWHSRKHHQTWRAWCVAGLSALCLITIWVLWALMTVKDLRVVRPLSTGAVIWHYLGNPTELWGVFERTFTNEDRLGFLAKSFIGNLGWLDTLLAPEAYPMLGIGLLVLLLLGPVSAVWRREEHGSPLRHLPELPLLRSSLTIAALSSALLSFLLMLWTWSPFPTELIEGVQGRYLLGPALVLAFALGESGRWRGAVETARPASQASPTIRAIVGWIAIASFAGLSGWFLWNTLLIRYPEWARGSLWG